MGSKTGRLTLKKCPTAIYKFHNNRKKENNPVMMSIAYEKLEGNNVFNIYAKYVKPFGGKEKFTIC